ncbi:alpha/beta fold hydrolase [Rhodococcus sp. IEGM 1381]|uniref:alpha/beta fold hydrolase n=1 Tax=Rhodococcus sp. IEGM 1381 TaxID=3047085 RepID=UPI0024B7AB46|nr:alpha/beta fold hydrolase [Rhodococcus sp. IEGM 1381]MDI9897442.1 alpha/beta fold hydrolase [Rhodococcus sp. IEGM 1381]
MKIRSTVILSTAAALIGGAGLLTPIADAAPATSIDVLPRLIDGAAAGYALSYSTTDEHGRPAIARGQVYLPSGTPPPGGWPVVSWAKGTVGIGDSCAMSTALDDGAAEDPLAVELSKPLLTQLLRSGAAVVSTDYIGLGTSDAHHYLNSVSEANAVTDIVRAAADELPELSRTWVAAGHSQGGAAALAAGARADIYGAPSDFRGVMSFAPSSNLEAILPLLSPTVPRIAQLDSVTATLIYVLYGLRDSRPDLDVDSYLSEVGRSYVGQAEASCISDLRQDVIGVAPQQLLTRSLSDPAMTSALREYLSVPTKGYSRPVVIEQGLADTVVPPALTTALSAELLARGVSDVTYLPLPGATHYDIIAATVDDALPRILRLLR